MDFIPKTLLLLAVLITSHCHAFEFSDQDSRVQVTQIGQIVPAESVGNLVVIKNRLTTDTRSLCTAILIAEQYLMTSAHCVFDHLGATPAMSVEFFPQFLGEGQQKRSRVFIEEGWIHKQYIKEDYKEVQQFPNGLVSLNRNTHTSDLAILKVINPNTGQGLGKRFGYVKPIGESAISTEAHHLPVSLLSYPSDKAEHTLWYQDCELKKTSSLIGQSNCRVAPGASGAGIMMKDPKTRRNRLIGVLSSAKENGHISEAVLFSNEVIQDIEQIIARHPDKVTQFEQVAFKTTKKVYIHIENRCDREIIAQAYHQPEGRDDWGVIKRTIPINRSALFNAINSRTWYSNIRDKNNTPYNVGRDKAFLIDGETYFFKQRAVPYLNDNGGLFYGDYFLRVHCL
ncbi:trypsin-like serine peptidase [Shewanella aquimarina]|uniref:trypsin-like serine peptidase n=1 Tax=Shewanella aquimarina TaxID=260365 RepID=UPI002014A82F|nr:trypsin-like serine protease [Shewanella aquimarina]MCL2909139.1 S1 family peptidase [Shewanella aquimarina]